MRGFTRASWSVSNALTAACSSFTCPSISELRASSSVAASRCWGVSDFSRASSGDTVSRMRAMFFSSRFTSSARATYSVSHLWSTPAAMLVRDSPSPPTTPAVTAPSAVTCPVTIRPRGISTAPRVRMTLWVISDSASTPSPASISASRMNFARTRPPTTIGSRPVPTTPPLTIRSPPTTSRADSTVPLTSRSPPASISEPASTSPFTTTAPLWWMWPVSRPTLPAMVYTLSTATTPEASRTRPSTPA